MATPFALHERTLDAIDDAALSRVVAERLASNSPRHPLRSVVDELGFTLDEFEGSAVVSFPAKHEEGS